jgi:hypothetical protein
VARNPPATKPSRPWLKRLTRLHFSEPESPPLRTPNFRHKKGTHNLHSIHVKYGLRKDYPLIPTLCNFNWHPSNSTKSQQTEKSLPNSSNAFILSLCLSHLHLANPDPHPATSLRTHLDSDSDCRMPYIALDYTSRSNETDF